MHQIRYFFSNSMSMGLVLINLTLCSSHLQAQTAVEHVRFVRFSQKIDSSATPVPIIVSAANPVQTTSSGAGFVINAVFDASIDATTQSVITNAIAFYEKTFTNNMTVKIGFYNMSSGLGMSLVPVYEVPYSAFRSALAAQATSADDAIALANTPTGQTNPVTGNSMIAVHFANGIALGLLAQEPAFPTGTSCPGLVASGCIGLNVAVANSVGNLLEVVEHEIDEVLGLGSRLPDVTTPSIPFPEDLFRWASPGVRSYSANACPAPSAFFSIDGGTTFLDEFNNCNNNGDYGDWVNHTPAQVQDAFTGGGGTSLAITSPEVRALDVIGYSVAAQKRRGQITSN